MPLSLRRPGWTVAIAAVLILAFGILGSGVESRLKPTTLSVSDTPSGRAAALLKSHFGDSAPFAILLRGPAASLDRQGPALIRTLRRDPDVTTLSPWDGASLGRFRPRPGKALILADFHVPTAAAVSDVVPYLDETLARRIHSPVMATQTGYASLSRAIQSESISSTEQAELLAIPFLLIVLLLIFRSPVAAAIPLAFGAITVLVSRGVLYLAAGQIDVDAFSLTVATMMGLALGVDYTLLMVSRFREELAAGAPAGQAAWSTRRTAGRTTLFAGSTLLASMVVSIFVLPGSLLLSLAGTAILVTAISVVVSNNLAPALLSLLGANVNRWHLGRRAEADGGHSILSRWLRTALRRPALVAGLIGAILLVLALPALAVKTGPPSVDQLPTSSGARQDAELVAREMGPGWDSPLIVVAATEEGAITSAPDLRHLARFQSLLAAQPGVQAVIGPGRIAGRSARLQRQGRGLLGAPGKRRLDRLSELGPGLERAGAGVGQLRAGLERAATGAGLLGEGSGRAQQGAAQIAAGLDRAAVGGAGASGAIDRLAKGASSLAEGQHAARAGTLSVALGLRDLLPQLRGGSLSRARRLRTALSQRAVSDPSLRAAASQASALVLALSAARNEVRSLRNRAARVDAGAQRLAAGGSKLADGTERLAQGAGSLGGVLDRLAGGAGALAGGLGRLTGGTEALAAGLREGSARSAPLAGGLNRAAVKVAATSDSLARRRAALRRTSPHLFDSGFFVLSALDGAPARSRDRVAQAVDLGHGGQAAAILIIPRYSLNSAASEALDRRLNHLTALFGQKAGLKTGVAGGAAQLTDYNQITRTHVPLVILAMTLVTFLALVAILRALLLAALAVILNLATVGIAFGVLVLLFHLPAGWPLGGHHYVDAIGAAAIFGIVFGLSVDYAVFLLARIRESYEETGDHRGAITFGLERTAGVITGAAAIMIVVFVCFAAAKISTVSQLGVGLTVAVFLDATVVRIVLLPALMILIGERVWWLPNSLQRVLPKIELHPA